MKPELMKQKNGQEIDIHRTAKTLVERHGGDAVLIARRWADCAARAGNQQRAVAWRQIVDAVTGGCSASLTAAPACKLLVAQSRAA